MHIKDKAIFKYNSSIAIDKAQTKKITYATHVHIGDLKMFY